MGGLFYFQNDEYLYANEIWIAINGKIIKIFFCFFQKIFLLYWMKYFEKFTAKTSGKFFFFLFFTNKNR